MPQTITVLRSTRPILAKRWCTDGAIKEYDRAKHFTVEQASVETLADVHALLERLQGDRLACLIRGQPAPGTLGRVTQRTLDDFVDEPSRLFMVDVDNFTPKVSVLDDPQAAVDEFIATLPEPFHLAGCVWQLSGSCGHESKKGVLRAHLWFLLESPLTCEQAEAFCKQHVPTADATVHRTVQVNYTAAPVMDGDLVDPLAGRRLGLIDGLDGEAVRLDKLPVPDVSQARRVKRAQRADMQDPRLKPGVVGAVCRAWEPAQVTQLFPEMFTEGTTPERLNWEFGGGSREGLRVTDSGLHLLNSHSTSPSKDRAVNLFDFIRLHVFGHLDADIDPDAAGLSPTALPSYRATEQWAREQPEVLAELQSAEAVQARERQADAQAAVKLSVEEVTKSEERMLNIKRLINEAETLKVLEHDIARRVAKHTDISAAEREVIAQAMQKRTAALMGSRGLPVSMVRHWLQQSIEPSLTFPDLGAEGTPLATIANLEVLCGRLGLTCKYNVISKRIELTGGTISFSDDNYANASLSWLKSECLKAGISVSMGDLKGLITAVGDRHQYNPVQAWIESAAWDGRSRLQDLADTLVTPDDFDAKHKFTLLKKWLVQSVAIACSSTPVQARGVLTLVGGQYIGKGRWLISLCPGLRELVITGLHLNPHDKDSKKKVISHWLSELGELESTFNRDMAAIKAFISDEEDLMRLPYAAEESKFRRRTSLFASVNSDTFLKDMTGNTRFWCIPVDKVNHEHGIDMQQLWAEVYALWDEGRGETHYLSPDEMTRVVGESSERFNEADPVVERIQIGFEWDKADDARQWTWMTATQALAHVGVPNPRRPDLVAAASVIKRLNGGKTQRGGAAGHRQLLVPVPAGSQALSG